MERTIYKRISSYILMIAMLLSSGCKDEVIPQPPDNSKPDNSKNEYTIKGKILNGTTMEPKYPGMVLNLVVSYKDFAETKTEVLGQCKMDNQGAFEISYKHSKIAENSSATLNFRSSFYNSPFLPKNQNIDTTISESSWGSIDIYLDASGYTENDTLYIATPSNNKLVFDTIPLPFKGFYTRIRSIKGKSGIDYLINDPIINYYNLDKQGYTKPVKGTTFQITGDPFIDSLHYQIP